MFTDGLRQLIAPFLEMRPTDVIDIVVATSIAYALIAWIRRTQAAQVAAGIVILGIVYIFARALDLQLTAWMFQGFFAIFLVVVVVIFQEELRQLFERLATYRFRGRRTEPSPTLASLDVLVQTLTELARDRVGALVVLPGRQPISRHVQGGIEINGQLSLPLLKSLFDPHSPGHDGAVIVDDGRVVRFATHLPLSKDFGQLTRVGTRHSAALGLAELSDALCLVVSEERGRISVARDSTLVALESPAQLGQIVAHFLEERRPAEKASWWPTLLRGNLAEKAAALVLVLGLWLLMVPGSRPRLESFAVPVRVINLPEEYVLEQTVPEIVEVTLSGPQRSFVLLDPNSLEVAVDASLARLGRRTYRVTDDNLVYPTALSLEAVNPGTVRISVRKSD